MKKLLVIAIALASTNAFASRARVTSLGGAAHVLDTQSIYSNPAKMHLMGDFVNLESGVTATSAVSSTVNPKNNAEGMVVRSMGDAKMALALGHKSENASAYGLRSIIDSALSATTEQQNPVEITYGAKAGDMSWAGTFVYSNYNDKKNEVKENSMGVRFGALTGAWDIALALGLGNTVTDKTAFGGQGAKFKGTMGVSADVGYTMDNLYTYGGVVLAGAKLENDTTGAELAKVDKTAFNVGVTSSHKKDGNEFFYGAELVNEETKNKTSDAKVTAMSLPVIVGFEVEGASWLTLRGSLTQTVFVNNSKTTVGSATSAEVAPGANNTVAAVGAGLKFNKITVDGSLQGLTGGAAGQNLDGNTLLTTVGLTYMF